MAMTLTRDEDGRTFLSILDAQPLLNSIQVAMLYPCSQEQCRHEHRFSREADYDLDALHPGRNRVLRGIPYPIARIKLDPRESR